MGLSISHKHNAQLKTYLIVSFKNIMDFVQLVRMAIFLITVNVNNPQ